MQDEKRRASKREKIMKEKKQKRNGNETKKK
jgi:hypothetical protein